MHLPIETQKEKLYWQEQEKVNQAELHTQEMSQKKTKESSDYQEIMVMKNWSNYNLIKVPKATGGHGGGDQRLQDMIFRNPNMPNPLHHAERTRDGALSALIGIASRTSIDTGKPIKIADFTDIELIAKRPEKKQG